MPGFTDHRAEMSLPGFSRTHGGQPINITAQIAAAPDGSLAALLQLADSEGHSIANHVEPGALVKFGSWLVEQGQRMVEQITTPGVLIVTADNVTKVWATCTRVLVLGRQVILSDVAGDVLHTYDIDELKALRPNVDGMEGNIDA